MNSLKKQEKGIGRESPPSRNVSYKANVNGFLTYFEGLLTYSQFFTKKEKVTKRKKGLLLRLFNNIFSVKDTIIVD